MFIDLTVKINIGEGKEEGLNPSGKIFGHIGTHFDVMDKTFPLEYFRREAVLFDVSSVGDREIDIGDIELAMVQKGVAVLFRSDFIEKEKYGSKEYFKNHPVLSPELIDALLDRQIALIGIDFPGIRRGKEHTPADQRCADRDVFVLENLCNLDRLIPGPAGGKIFLYTFPVNFAGLTGLPCRVAAEIDV